jgi:lysophospholipase L1-like esterase
MDKTRLKIAFIGDSLTEGVVGASYFEILKNKLPQHDLFNYGKGGDTVISLYHRMHRVSFESPLDVGFLWIGVNDVLVKTRWSFPLVKRLRGQPWAKSHNQFRNFYCSLLEFLLGKITHIFILPPLLIGEDIDNAWNKELAVLAKNIHDLSVSYPNVEFVDLREHFIPHLASKNISSYVPKNVFRVIMDALFIKTPEELEKKAAEIGLHFTIDGAHLNKIGAEKVADVLLDKIRSKFPFSFIDT